MSELSAFPSKLPAEQETIRAKCFHPTGTFVKFPIEDVETSIPERFEKIVRMYPNRIAVKLGDQSWTYDALNGMANRLARNIIRRCGEKTEPITLIGDNDCRAIAAYLGLLKACKIAVIIDPSFPRERSAQLLAKSRARYLVTDSGHLEQAKALGESVTHVINFDALPSDLDNGNLGLRIAPDAIAQIVYTSGSTGYSKGVFFNHRRILYDIMEDVNAAHTSPDDRLTQFRKLTFSWGIKDLFRGLR